MALRFVSKPWISPAPYRSVLLNISYSFSAPTTRLRLFRLLGTLFMTLSHVSYAEKIIHFSTGPEYTVVFLISIINTLRIREKKTCNG